MSQDKDVFAKAARLESENERLKAELEPLRKVAATALRWADARQVAIALVAATELDNALCEYRKFKEGR